jgi:isopentenyl phosphate kinase
MSKYLKNLTILKLGGSVITDKAKQSQVDTAIIQRVAKEVSTVTSGSWRRLIRSPNSKKIPDP